MGSSFAVGKMGLSYASPLFLAGVRFALAGVVMAIGVVAWKRPHPAYVGDWFRIAVVGLFQTALVMGCIFVSLRTISAGESSILTFVNPLFVVVFGTLFLGTKYQPVQWLGVFLGFAGVATTLGFQWRLQVGTGIGLAGAGSWAVATLLINRWRHRFDVWVLTAYQMLFGGGFLLVGSVVLEHPRFAVNLSSLTITLWLAIMGSIVQFAIWFFLLQRGEPGKTSAFLFLAPFFGVVFGWLLLKEPVSWRVFFGGLLIIAGIFLVNWPRPQEGPRTVLSEKETL